MTYKDTIDPEPSVGCAIALLRCGLSTLPQQTVRAGELWVAGREVIAEGRLTGLDAHVAEDDLRTRCRIAMPATANFRAD